MTGSHATGNTRAKAPADLQVHPAYAELTTWAPESSEDTPMADAVAVEPVGCAAQSARQAIDRIVAGIAGRLVMINADLAALGFDPDVDAGV